METEKILSISYQDIRRIENEMNYFMSFANMYESPILEKDSDKLISEDVRDYLEQKQEVENGFGYFSDLGIENYNSANLNELVSGDHRKEGRMVQRFAEKFFEDDPEFFYLGYFQTRELLSKITKEPLESKYFHEGFNGMRRSFTITEAGTEFDFSWHTKNLDKNLIDWFTSEHREIEDEDEAFKYTVGFMLVSMCYASRENNKNNQIK